MTRSLKKRFKPAASSAEDTCGQNAQHQASTAEAIAKKIIHDAGRLAESKGHTAALGFLIKKMEETKSTSPALLERAASYALKAKLFKHAEKLIELSLAMSPLREPALHLKALMLTRTGERDTEAFKTAELLYSVNPRDKEGALMYAIGLAAQERYEEMLGVTKTLSRQDACRNIKCDEWL